MGTPLIEILLVDHHPNDIQTMMEAFREMKLANPVNIMQDISNIMDYLNRCGQYISASRPDLILLEPFLSLQDDHDLMYAVKACASLHGIPVILVLDSKDEWEQVQSMGFDFHNYVTRPLTIPSLIKVITDIDNFWLMIGQ